MNPFLNLTFRKQCALHFLVMLEELKLVSASSVPLPFYAAQRLLYSFSAAVREALK